MDHSKFNHNVLWCARLLALGLVGLALGAASPVAPAQPAPPVRTLSLTNKALMGDFDAMLQRRAIRVLLPNSRTLYFTDKGRERGIAGDLLRAFEAHLNKKFAKVLGKRPLSVILIPCTRDLLLKDVAAGLGDLAAGNLTRTEERLKLVDFVVPKNFKDVHEVVVTGAGAADLATVEDLSGRTVHVKASSSYYESLQALNQRLRQAKRPEVNLVLVSEALENEDLLEMANAGMLDYLVVDDWLGRIWAQILPKIKVRQDLVLRANVQLGWALRKDSPKLQAELEEFLVKSHHTQKAMEARITMYQKRIVQIRNAKGGPEYQRFEKVLGLFQKYGRQYGFDPIMLAAQGYQESTLDQGQRSHRGAVGIMQIMPATGAELKVGNIQKVEPNIHAGAKYMDQLMTKYFADAHFSEQDHSLFAFASYNAGPGNIARMRDLARKKGLDPDVWFNNVEVITAAKIGIETTTYVRNIYKYYVAYKLTLVIQEQARQASQELAGKTPN